MVGTRKEIPQRLACGELIVKLRIKGRISWLVGLVGPRGILIPPLLLRGKLAFLRIRRILKWDGPARSKEAQPPMTEQPNHSMVLEKPADPTKAGCSNPSRNLLDPFSGLQISPMPPPPEPIRSLGSRKHFRRTTPELPSLKILPKSKPKKIAKRKKSVKDGVRELLLSEMTRNPESEEAMEVVPELAQIGVSTITEACPSQEKTSQEMVIGAKGGWDLNVPSTA
ncbi:hypothetical protein LINPERHAP1_LOCUS22323 [Linum perenne]